MQETLHDYYTSISIGGNPSTTLDSLMTLTSSEDLPNRHYERASIWDGGQHGEGEDHGEH
ncbi:hypothetical protein DPMN_118327 [Dreissena polymorpha]|uniref:Uncharacterized protein n=1 Tax=Dreissena polymorpha TaxID=45954 RepID=A0A9D4GGK0_DREPO|nr:hypothetical protein DPMN_118327 [Dreissena polymorpha]